MSADEMSWPDKDRPGVPRNPEVDGWHWLLSSPGRTFVAHWNGPLRCWFYSGDDRHHEPAEAAAFNAYLGPVLTDADLATTARVHAAAGFKAGVEACIEEAKAEMQTAKAIAPMAWAGVSSVLGRLNALPTPDASALDAALERARQEEREVVARWHEAKAADCDGKLRYFRSPAGLSTHVCGSQGADAAARDYEQLAATHRASAAAIRARTPTTGETTDAG